MDKGVATCALQREAKGECKVPHTCCGSLAIVVEAKVPAVPLCHAAIVVTLDNTQEIRCPCESIHHPFYSSVVRFTDNCAVHQPTISDMIDETPEPRQLLSTRASGALRRVQQLCSC